MGYHVTILRPTGHPNQSITISDLQSDSVENLGWRYVTENDSVSLKNGQDPTQTLYLSEGTLWTSNPTEAALRRMVELAEVLGARVRGDELETYRADLTTHVHPDDKGQASATRLSRTKVFWHRYGASMVILAVFLSVVILLNRFGVLE